MMKAMIKWVSSQDGGRRVLPTLAYYRAPIKFPGKDYYYDVEVHFCEPPKVDIYTPTIVSFVSEESQKSSEKEKDFELYEGAKVVAKGYFYE